MKDMDLLDAVYAERNLLAQLLAAVLSRKGYTVSWRRDPSEPDWPVLLMESPAGQLSYHMRADEVLLSLPEVPWQSWDGHTTAEKHDRVRAYLASWKAK